MIDFRLLRIRIFNFACYLGDNTIDLSSRSSKNIFLFNLPNGYGKTSLFHAIKWGFYGEKIDYFKDSDSVSTKDFLNDRLDPEEDLCFVEITFEYGKETYELKRTYKPSSSRESYFTLVKDGREIVAYEEKRECLDQIIPPNLADFFMFDGEQLSRFMVAQKELYRDSVHQLLGLKQLRILKEDLEGLYVQWERKLTQLASSIEEVEERKRGIQNIEREIENRNLLINEIKTKIASDQKTRDGLDERRRAYQNLPDVMKQLNEVNDKQLALTREITHLKEQLEASSEHLFVSFIKADLKTHIERNNARIAELKEICGLSDTQAETQATKAAILKKSIPVCDVCGHKLDGEEVKSLQEEQRKIKESLHLFDINRKERDSLRNENNMFQDMLQVLKETDYSKLLDDLAEAQHKFEVSEKLKDKLNLESQKEKYGTFATINIEISSLDISKTKGEDKIKLLNVEISRLLDMKRELVNDIQRLGHDDKITRRIVAMTQYLAKLTKQLDETLDAGTQFKRDRILEKSNELFKQITNKPDEYAGLEFESDDSFAFVIKTKDGHIVTNPSKGEKQVRAMSFLLGLNQYTGRNSVIVMDTPVASLDDVHSAGIGKALSKLDNQVVFLAQPQELAGDIYKNMKSGIAREFIVERHDYSSTFKEVKA